MTVQVTFRSTLRSTSTETGSGRVSLIIGPRCTHLTREVKRGLLSLRKVVDHNPSTPVPY